MPHRPIRHLARQLIPCLFALCVGHAAFAADTGAPSPRYGTFGIDTLAIDATVRPGADFWTYANGAWARTARFAGNQEVAGVAVDVADAADRRLASLMTGPGLAASSDSDQRRIALFHASWMNTAAIERRGTSPLRPYLSRIDRIASATAVASAFGAAGFASPLDIDVAPSPTDPTRNEVHVAAGSLGMPPAYYTSAGPSYDATRAAYRVYVQRMLALAGIESPAAKAQGIVALEQRLAQARSTGDGTPTVMPADALPTQLPGIEWPALLGAKGLGTAHDIQLDDGAAVRAIVRIVADVPRDTWKDYLVFRFVSDHATLLPRAFATAHDAFYDATLSGLTAPRDRKVQGIRLVNRLLPEAVGRLYMARFFDGATRTQMRELFEDVRAAYGDLVEHAEWMDADTRRAARAKVASLTACIGGPERRTDFSDLAIARDDPFGNVLRAEAKRASLLAQSLDAPLPACERYGMAQGANDFYVREANQILLPAGSLTPPFFDPAADAAVNYGAIGVTIGHEIGHGFDVDGARYDAHGKVGNGWSASASEAFARNKARVVEQYAAIEVLPGLHIDGERTLGENMADLTGTEAAFRAYARYQQRHGKAPVLDGLTGEQRFFLSLAQMRRSLVRDETLRFLVVSDTHSPSRPRVNAAVRNLDAWYEAFPIRTTDPLYLSPDRRIHLW